MPATKRASVINQSRQFYLVHVCVCACGEGVDQAPLLLRVLVLLLETTLLQGCSILLQEDFDQGQDPPPHICGGDVKMKKAGKIHFLCFSMIWDRWEVKSYFFIL